MEVGQLLVTRDDLADPKRVYYGYDQPDGRAISNVGRKITVGQFVAETRAGGLFGFGQTLWYQVKLTQPISNQGTTYVQVWMKAEDLTVSLETPVPVWATLKGAVVYQRPATTSNVLQRKTAAQLVGTSEGTHNGAFLYVKLATAANGYTYGYVLANQLSTQDPTLISDTPGSGLYTDQTGWLARAIGQEKALIVRTVVIVILIALVGYAGWNFNKQRNDR